MSVAKKAVALKNFFPFYMVRGLMIFIQSEIFGNRRTNWKFIDTRLKTSESKQKKKQFTVRLFDTVEIPQVLRGEQSVKSEPWIAIS